MSDRPIDEKAIFNTARKIADSGARESYLSLACGDDEAAMQRIRDLIQVHIHEDSFLESPPPGIEPTDIRPITEQPGDTIGPYRLLQQIGEGGMGTVFMAEQSEPIERRVALKIIKPGMDTQQVIARFEAERQALAMMDHPNIAKVFDAGKTDTGRPYFVMELVKGIPITSYCDQQHLSVRERLELFLPVCQAIRHAHQKGIIHRDVKPTNVLVACYDDAPVPKIIDFGISKAINQKLTERTMFTHYGQVIGTIEYMSPEQGSFNQLDVDTRSDIYSLGVLLYELLTGVTPFDRDRLRAVGLDELLQILREEEPPRLSTRLKLSDTLPVAAANRSTSPAQLTAKLRGELDWIVMKALEKCRDRRYQTAGELTQDVLHFLNDEPILASAPSAWSRMTKLVRRRKRVVFVATLLVVSLGSVVVSIGWHYRERALDDAVAVQKAERTLENVEQLLRERRWTEAYSALSHADSLLSNTSRTQPIELHINERLRTVQLLLDSESIRLEQAEVVLEEHRFNLESAAENYALAFQRWGCKPHVTSPELTAARIEGMPESVRLEVLAALYNWQRVATPQTKPWVDAVIRAADSDDWRSSFRTAVYNNEVEALRSLAFDPEIADQPPEVLAVFAASLYDAGATDESNTVLEIAHLDYPQDFWIAFQLGLTYEALDRLDQALPSYAAALSLRPNVVAYLALGSVCRRTGDVQRAVLLYRKALSLRPEYAKAHYNLGIALLDLADPPAAIVALENAVRIDPQFSRAWYWLGRAHARNAQYAEALTAFQRSLAEDGRATRQFTRLGTARRLRINEISWHLSQTVPALNSAFRQIADSSLYQEDNDLEVTFQHAAELILEHDLSTYRKMCENALERFRETSDPRRLYLLARLCSLHPGNEVDASEIIQLGERALDHGPGPHRLHTLGLAHLRAGNYSSAIAHLERSLQMPWRGRGATYLALRLACESAGNETAASDWSSQFDEWMSDQPLELNSDLHPHDRAECRILLQELNDQRTKVMAVP